MWFRTRLGQDYTVVSGTRPVRAVTMPHQVSEVPVVVEPRPVAVAPSSVCKPAADRPLAV